jgi:hypothetical protein
VVVNQIYAIPQGTNLTLSMPGVLVNASDPDNDTITVVGYTQPPNGNVTVFPNGSFVYVPVPSFTGNDTFTFNVTDNKGGYTQGTVTVVVGEHTRGLIAVVVVVRGGRCGGSWGGLS